MTKFNYVCATCGSEDVLIDAYAAWNKKTQEFEVASTFDKGHFCNACEGDCSIKEVLIPQYTLDGDPVDLEFFFILNQESLNEFEIRSIKCLRSGESFAFGGGAAANQNLKRVS